MKIYITTCSRHVNRARMLSKILKNGPYEYTFVYGKNNETRVDPHIVLDTEEAYENLPKKTYLLIEHFLNTSKEGNLLKIDDDTYLDIAQLKKYELAPEDYIGHFVQAKMDDPMNLIFHWYKITNPSYRVKMQITTTPYAEGSFYILSRRACEIILQRGPAYFESTPETYRGEDMTVGKVLSEANVISKDIAWPVLGGYEITQDFCSIHPVHPILMPRLAEAADKVSLLKKYNYINDNLLRSNYLTKITGVVQSNPFSTS